MIIVAESGSTKTDWMVSDGNSSSFLRTGGLNPQLGEFNGNIAEEVSAWIKGISGTENLEAFYFYGAGVLPGKAEERLRRLFAPLFPCGHMEFGSDLIAAARATCGDNAGIVAILGTGANSCLWDGCRIVQHVPALGYILGDEGGGAYIGRRLLSDYLKGVMPAPTAAAFSAAYEISEEDVIRKVYAEPYPNRYMASFVPFAAENMALPGIARIVEEGFSEFVKRNLYPYPTDRYPVNFVGSVASVFRPVLEDVCHRFSIVTGKVVAAPADELFRYHIDKVCGAAHGNRM